MRLIGRVAGILAVTLMIGSFALVGAAAVGATSRSHTGDPCAQNARSSECTTLTTAAPPTTVPPTTTTKPKPTTTTVKPPGGAVQPTTTTTAPPPVVSAPPEAPAPPADAPAAVPPRNTGSPGSSGVGTGIGTALAPAAPPSGAGVPTARDALDVPPLPGAVLTDDSVLIPGSIALMIAAAGLGMLFLVMQGAAGRRGPAAATVPVDDGRTLEFQ